MTVRTLRNLRTLRGRSALRRGQCNTTQGKEARHANQVRPTCNKRLEARARQTTQEDLSLFPFATLPTPCPRPPSISLVLSSTAAPVYIPCGYSFELFQ
jgi:hypothetical protein